MVKKSESKSYWGFEELRKAETPQPAQMKLGLA